MYLVPHGNGLIHIWHAQSHALVWIGIFTARLVARARDPPLLPTSVFVDVNPNDPTPMLSWDLQALWEAKFKQCNTSKHKKAMNNIAKAKNKKQRQLNKQIKETIK